MVCMNFIIRPCYYDNILHSDLNYSEGTKAYTVNKAVAMHYSNYAGGGACPRLFNGCMHGPMNVVDSIPNRIIMHTNISTSLEV